MTDSDLDRNTMAQALLPAVNEASRAILDVYATDFAVQTKEDDSPLTRADKASHAVLTAALARLYPHIPVLSEEGDLPGYEVRSRWERFFLVDPLDGTKEFVKRNDEFCVNIGLVEGGRPVFGMIAEPVPDAVYWGGPGLGAFRRTASGATESIRVAVPGPDGPVMVSSRSHPSPELTRFAEVHGITQVRPVGAAFKFCRMAEGTAHAYPRYNPTMEWDTAAGHAILEGAGGSLMNWDGSAFAYNKPSLKNGGFIATAGWSHAKG